MAPDGVGPVGPSRGSVPPAVGSGAFRAALSDALQWSKHAEQRAVARAVALKPDEVQRVAGAVSDARRRGVRSLVVVLPESVMLVAPATNTVVTAMPRGDAERRLFTNVDAVVLLGRS